MIRKSLKSLILILAITITCFAVNFSINAEKIGDFEYSINENGTVEITKYSGSEMNLVIPSDINGQAVTSIGPYAFSCCNSDSIVIPNGITKISSHAFSGCSNITNIMIPKSVTEIEDLIFNLCESLQNIEVDEQNKNYSSQNGVLFDKDKTTLIFYPHAKSDEQYIVEDSVTKIEDLAFSSYGNKIDYQGVKYLKKIVLPNSVIYIGERAFADCESLETIILSENINHIGEGAFSNCTNLKNINIPLELTEINKYVFSGCKSLSGMIIPDQITTIDDHAFGGCSGLTSITIPESVLSIGSMAFSSCTNLKEVNISNISRWCQIEFKDMQSNPLYFGRNLFVNGKLCQDIVLPENIFLISDYSFYNCDSLTNIVIPDTITEIASYAFCECDNLKNITLPNSLTTIGDNAFRSCKSLESIVIPNNISLIDLYTFLDCTNLKDVTIGDNVSEIYAAAFMNCENIENVYISNINNWCNLDLGGNGWAFTSKRYYSNPLYYADNLFLNGEIVENLIIPDGVTNVKPSVFYNYKKLRNIVIPNSVTNIGNGAFYNCNLNLVHYIGTPDNWKEIKIGTDNNALNETIIHYNCYTVEQKDATCTINGHTMGIYCSFCEAYIAGYDEIPASHKFGEWIQTESPTCTEQGREHRYCSDCNYYETREIKPYDHQDKDGDGICDIGGEALTHESNCNHLCHSNNKFIQFIWTIINLFYKIFKVNKICSCGAIHY